MHYYFDAGIKSSSYTQYEDDGNTNGTMEKGWDEFLQFNAVTIAKGIQFSLSKTGGTYEGMPLERTVTFIIHNVQKQPVSVKSGNNKIVSAWDKEHKQLRFSFNWKMKPEKIEITY